jgi:selenide, water dikinase
LKKLILIGGGHAHVEVLRQCGLARLPNVEVTLVSPDRHTPYSGMLPGLVAGHYTFEQCHIDLKPLADYAGARLTLKHVLALDAARRVVQLDDGSELGYDIASIDVGSVPLAQDIAGVADHAIPVKPVRGYLAAWEMLQARVRAGAVRCIAVVGGGAAGVEMLLAMQYRLAQLNLPRVPDFALITDTPQLLPQHARGVRAVLERSLARKRVAVHREMRVTRVAADALSGCDVHGCGQRISADAVVWVTGAAPAGWLLRSGLALNERKFLNINKYLQSSSHDSVFAAGDCATIAGVTYPKSGVYAVRQGPVLAQNLRRALSGSAALLAYTPQKKALALISSGERHAIASWGAMAFHGEWVWRWKDRIDQAFMAKYRKV